jgi:hypothetical protein
MVSLKLNLLLTLNVTIKVIFMLLNEIDFYGQTRCNFKGNHQFFFLIVCSQNKIFDILCGFFLLTLNLPQ